MLGTLDPEHDKLVPKPDEPDYVPDELDPEPEEEDPQHDTLVPESDKLVDKHDEDHLMQLSSDGDSMRRQRSKSINWVSRGKVHPVKDQWRWDSSSAFTATTVQESMHAI